MNGFRLKGIKSFIDSKDIELKPITIFVGENSSGKSSLLRFNSVIAQTFKEEVFTPLLLFGKMIDYGSYDEVRNSNNTNEEIYFEINFGDLEKTEIRMLSRYRYDLAEKAQSFLNKELRIEVTLYCEQKIKLKKLTTYIGDEKILEITKTKSDKYKIESKLKNENLLGHGNVIESECKIRFYKFLPWELEGLEDMEISKLHKKYLNVLNSEHREEHQFIRFIYDARLRELKLENDYLKMYNEYLKIREHVGSLKLIIDACRERLINYSEKLNYIGPFRSKPERNYREYESTYDTVGVNGENTYQILKQNFDNKDQIVSKWLKDILGVGLNIDEIQGSNLYKIMIEDQQGTKTNLIDTGYGISQILPILTEVLSGKRDISNPRRIDLRRGLIRRNKKTLIIEQPELHLHPAAQSKLAELFLHFIKKGHNLILETHSEHLIKKFQILVAKDNEFSNNDIAIYYVHKDRGEGAKVERLLLDENGRFLNEWPTGFFDQGYKLASELLRTISSKKEITINEEILKKKESLRTKILLKKLTLEQERN